MAYFDLTGIVDDDEDQFDPWSVGKKLAPESLPIVETAPLRQASLHADEVPWGGIEPSQDFSRVVFGTPRAPEPSIAIDHRPATTKKTWHFDLTGIVDPVKPVKAVHQFDLTGIVDAPSHQTPTPVPSPLPTNYAAGAYDQPLPVRARTTDVELPAEITPLTPPEESAFQKWVKKNATAPGVKNWEQAPYDLRGFFNDKTALAAWHPGDHFPDTYKQHGHPTFSVESKYSSGPGDGGTWQGETFVPAPSASAQPDPFSPQQIQQSVRGGLVAPPAPIPQVRVQPIPSPTVPKLTQRETAAGGFAPIESEAIAGSWPVQSRGGEAPPVPPVKPGTVVPGGGQPRVGGPAVGNQPTYYPDTTGHLVEMTPGPQPEVLPAIPSPEPPPAIGFAAAAAGSLRPSPLEQEQLVQMAKRPVAGAARAASAVKRLMDAGLIQPSVGYIPEARPQKPLTEDETADAFTDVIYGVADASLPVVLTGLMASPLATVGTLVMSAGSTIAGEKAAKAAGLSEAKQRLAGAIAGTVAAGIGGKKVFDRIAAEGRAAVVAGKLLSSVPEESLGSGPVGPGAGLNPIFEDQLNYPKSQSLSIPKPPSESAQARAQARMQMVDALERGVSTPTPEEAAVAKPAPPASPDALIADLAGVKPAALASPKAKAVLDALAQHGIPEDVALAEAQALRGRQGRPEIVAEPPIEAEPARQPFPLPPKPELGGIATRAPQGLNPINVLAPEHRTNEPDLNGRTAEGETHTYGSTQLNLPEHVASQVRALGQQIPDAELAEDGREDQSHITLLFGTHARGDVAEKVRALLADEPPITVTLGKTSVFKAGPDGKSDVVKIDVDSPELHALNKKIAEALPHTDTYPTYQPHVTVAYVKPGEGQKYAGNAALAGQTITLDHVEVSSKDGEKIDIPLGGGTKTVQTPVSTGPLSDTEILDAAQQSLGYRPHSIASRHKATVTFNLSAPHPMEVPNVETYHLVSDLNLPQERVRQTIEPAAMQSEPWQMTRAEFRQADTAAKYQAIRDALQNGKTITLSIAQRVTPYTRPDQIRLTKAGGVQTMVGRGRWVNLVPPQVDQLAAQAGMVLPPISERTTHEDHVRQAVLSGKPVPTDVRAEYPDLPAAPTFVEKAASAVAGAIQAGAVPRRGNTVEYDQAGGRTVRGVVLDIYPNGDLSVQTTFKTTPVRRVTAGARPRVVQSEKAIANQKAFRADVARREAELTALGERFTQQGHLYAVDPRVPGHTLLLSPSTREGVKYQVTSFNNGEPTGHRDYDHLGIEEGQRSWTNSALSEFMGKTVTDRPRAVPAPPAPAKTLNELRREVTQLKQGQPMSLKQQMGKRGGTPSDEQVARYKAAMKAWQPAYDAARQAVKEAEAAAGIVDQTAAERAAALEEVKTLTEQDRRELNRILQEEEMFSFDPGGMQTTQTHEDKYTSRSAGAPVLHDVIKLTPGTAIPGHEDVQDAVRWLLTQGEHPDPKGQKGAGLTNVMVGAVRVARARAAGKAWDGHRLKDAMPWSSADPDSREGQLETLKNRLRYWTEPQLTQYYQQSEAGRREGWTDPVGAQLAHEAILETFADHGWDVPAYDERAAERPVDELVAADDAEGDDSFDPAELESAEASPAEVAPADPIIDATEAGPQPRLPEAGAARQVGRAETTFRAPTQASGDDFSLDPTVTKEAAAREKAAAEPDLFGGDDLAAAPPKQAHAAPVVATETQKALPASVQPSGGGGSTAAGVGDFDDTTPVRTGSVPGSIDQIRPIDVPELVALVHGLTANWPRIVKGFRKLGKRGEFSVYGIKLTADLFKKGQQRQLAAVLTHEIGHLIDWLPEGNLKRGNLIGRLRTLHHFLKGTFTEPDGHLIKNKDVRAELKALSAQWRPWDEATAEPSFKAYRNSARELYADAISVLLNNPGLLEAQAPIFYREFFRGLDAKPDVAADYFALQELLAGNREDLIQKSRERVRAGFASGEAKALELQKQMMASRAAERRDFGLHLRRLFVDKNAPVADLMAATVKRGIVIPEDENPIYLLEERNYIGGKQKAWLERNVLPLFQHLQAKDISWSDLGETLFNHRITAGDRHEMANPWGIGPVRATEHQTQLEARLGPRRVTTLMDGITTFRGAISDLMEEAYTSGLLTDETYKTMQENPAYAPFRVVEYLDTNVNWQVLRQIGTMKAVGNPADAFVLKALSTVRAIERQKMVSGVVGWLEQEHPSEVEDAKTRWNGKSHEPLDPKDRTQGLVTYYVKGKRVGKYVDAPIADAINNESIGRNGALMTVLNWMTGVPVFRPLFTTFNLGWQGKNFIRDFTRFWANTPSMSLGNAARLYTRAFPAARVRAFGLKEGEQIVGVDPNAPRSSRQQAFESLVDAEHAGILSVTYNDLAMGSKAETSESELETIFHRTGVEGFGAPRKHIVGIQQAVSLLNFVRALGDLIETLPKMAAIDYFSEGQGAEGLSPAQRSFIRRMIGTPDLLAGGTMTPATNKIFLYSNAALQGNRSDIHMLFHPEDVPRVGTGGGGAGGPGGPGAGPITGGLDPSGRGPRASGVRWKMVAGIFLPKLIMRLMLLGVFGEALRRILQSGSTKYDRRNYTVLPIMSDAKGNGVTVRVPTYEFGQFLGGLFEIALDTVLPVGTRDIPGSLQNLADYSGGQLPSVSPLPEVAVNTGQMLAGQRVYDTFRGQFVLSTDEAEAGGWRAWSKFLSWELQQSGAAAIWKWRVGQQSPEDKTTAQRVLEYPLTSVFPGNFVRITKYGTTEALGTITQQVRQGEAQQRLTERDAVNEAIRQYRQLPPGQQSLFEMRRLANQTAKTLYPTDRREELDRQDTIYKKLRLGVVRGSADPVIDAVLSATTNDQKVAILSKVAETLDQTALDQLLHEAVRSGVISPAVQFAVRKQRSRAIPAVPEPVGVGR